MTDCVNKNKVSWQRNDEAVYGLWIFIYLFIFSRIWNSVTWRFAGQKHVNGAYFFFFSKIGFWVAPPWPVSHENCVTTSVPGPFCRYLVMCGASSSSHCLHVLLLLSFPPSPLSFTLPASFTPPPSTFLLTTLYSLHPPLPKRTTQPLSFCNLFNPHLFVCVCVVNPWWWVCV